MSAEVRPIGQVGQRVGGAEHNGRVATPVALLVALRGRLDYLGGFRRETMYR